MIGALTLFLVPVSLYVIAFLYETYRSFARLSKSSARGTNYVGFTWEITHTLLVFAVVMLLMMYSQAIDSLSSAIFSSAFLALTALTVRAVLYLYIFFVKKTNRRSLVDWLFAFSHVFTAGVLLVVVYQAVRFVVANRPPVNSQFLPYFIPGLLLVIACTFLPIVWLYLFDDESNS